MILTSVLCSAAFTNYIRKSLLYQNMYWEVYWYDDKDLRTNNTLKSPCSSKRTYFEQNFNEEHIVCRTYYNKYDTRAARSRAEVTELGICLGKVCIESFVLQSYVP